MSVATHRAHIRQLLADMRDALVQFRKYDQEWNELNDAYQVKISEENRRRRESGRFPHTPLGIAQQKGDMLALSDAMAAAQWFRAKAEALGTVILAEKAAAEMLEEV